MLKKSRQRPKYGRNIVKRVFLLVVAISLQIQVSHAQSRASGLDLGLGLNSTYITEGRDHLGGGAWGTAQLMYRGDYFSAGIWRGFAVDDPYGETDLILGFDYAIGGFDLATSYTHRMYDLFGRNDNDNELAVALDYRGMEYLVPGLSYTYSTDAEGGWLEFRLAGEFASNAVQRLDLMPYALAGWNQGYVVGESTGLNHLQLGIEAQYHLFRNIQLTGYLAHTFPVNRRPQDTLADKSWAGVGVVFSF